MIAVDIDSKRLQAAIKNAKLFGVSDSLDFKILDMNKYESILSLGQLDAIFIDADWRRDVNLPIWEHSSDPFATCPRADTLYSNLRKAYPHIPVVFEVSPHSQVEKFSKLGPCLIEKIHVKGKFLLFHVTFADSVKMTWQKDVFI